MNTAIITNIQGFSIHDGPGIRTVVFFKGCPLSCQWCANPECLSKKPEIGFVHSLCKQCGKCSDVCPNNAIRSGEGVYRIERSHCDSCGKCVEGCDYGALVRYGDLMTVHEVWDAVRRDKLFYETSNGGVTVSGGEPLLNPQFVKELFELCQSEGIGTCVETCGFVDTHAYIEVIPVTELFLFDLKHMDSAVHKEVTGQFNEQILKNASVIIGSGVDVLFRQPLIPGVNDTETNIEATAMFIKTLGKKALSLELMPYHRMGQDKYKALNMEYRMEKTRIMSYDEVEAIKKAYIDLGIDCSISR
jgi:pyruvate formate lyase activating enzyme